MGIEPTNRRSSLRLDGFEDRARHQPRFHFRFFIESTLHPPEIRRFEKGLSPIPIVRLNLFRAPPVANLEFEKRSSLVPQVRRSIFCWLSAGKPVF